MKKTLQTPLC